MALLEFKNTSFTYALNNTKTLTNINLEIEEGEFVVICGPTGSGKSTLLKLIKKEIRPTGKLEGQILYKNQDLNNFSLKESVETFGLVMQNVDAQIVNEKVYSELAFGLSNLGYDVSTINRRIAEMSNYFGINNWYDRSTNNLSGGEKQILNLASILTMQPKVLLIDEATSQLDPITASEFIQVLRKINQDFGITVVVVEHRLDELFSIADKVVVLNEGQIVAVDKPREIAKKINDEKLYLNFPLMLRVAKKINAQSYPLTIKEGKNLLKSFSNKINLLDVKENQLGSKLIELKNIYFKYYQNQKDILSGLDLIIHENEVLSIIGSNGSGKTTLLKLIARLINPYYGKIKLDKKNLKKYNNKE
ncbi:MAG TPA: ABC transporter ATP-binding protein, partial [Acholeplasmataceae bacterium]|nr:ABC transporter ATP-binding protein [Acholeplasmataceae bacterium]